MLGSKRCAKAARCAELRWRASSHGSSSRPCSRTPSSSACFDRGLVGLRIGAARQADRAEAAAARRRDRAGRRIEVAVMAGLDPVGEQVETSAARRSRPRTGCERRMHGPRLRRPRAIGCRPAERRDRAGSRGRRPIANSRPMDRGGGEPVGKGEGERSARDRAALGDRHFDRSSRRPPALRPACGRLRRAATVGAPATPAQLQVGIIAAEAALGEQHRDFGRGCSRSRGRRLRSACARGAAPAAARRSRGHAAVRRPSSSIAPSVAQPLRALRARPRRAAGRGRAGGSGRLRPTAGRSSSRLDRSASRISGGSCAGSDARRRLLPQADGDSRAPGARRGRRAG